MSATIVYSTVAYLAARLYKRMWPRVVTMLIAAIVIVAISQIFRPSFLIGIVVVGGVSLLVFAINRHSLQIVDTYPELGRFRVIRRIFGDPRRDDD